MKIPRGELHQSRVVNDTAAALRTVLDEELTGFVVFGSQDMLLLDEAIRGIVTFEDGVPVLAYDAEREVGGHDGLGRFAATGLTRTTIHTVDAAELVGAHEVEAFRVPPGEPARVLASDERLATKTLDAAPAARREKSHDQSAVRAFLADASAIEGIQSEAREGAHTRASEQGLDDVLADDADESATIGADPDSR